MVSFPIDEADLSGPHSRRANFVMLHLIILPSLFLDFYPLNTHKHEGKHRLKRLKIKKNKTASLPASLMGKLGCG